MIRRSDFLTRHSDIARAKSCVKNSVARPVGKITDRLGFLLG